MAKSVKNKSVRRKNSKNSKNKQQHIKQQHTNIKRPKVAASDVLALKDKIMQEVSKQDEQSKSVSSVSTGKLEGRVEKKVESRQVPIAPKPVNVPKKVVHRPFMIRVKENAFSAALVAAVLVIISLLLVSEQTQQPSPSATLASLEQALIKGDSELLLEQIDADRVAMSIVEQFYNNPQMDVEQLPEDLRKHLPSDAKTLQGMIKPGLAETLKRDAFSLASGDADFENLASGLFKRVWEGLADGKKLTVSKVRRVVADNNVAEMDIMLKRADLVGAVPLTLRMENQSGQWKLVEVLDVQKTVLAMVSAEKVEENVKNVKITSVDSSKMYAGNALQVESVRKTSAAHIENETSILVTLKLRNVGPDDVTAFSAEVLFNDAAGQKIKSFTLSDAIGVQRGMRLEKTWRLPINMAQRLEKHIYKLPQEAMQVLVIPKVVELADGRVLKVDS